ncbi:MAG: polysaccharide biosynthesis protein [Oscillospiraceae bacterium]|nr:polysaccharide biosynthesis protein [Oscillospiraceae bacterium]
MTERSEKNYLKGAAILAASVVIAKLVGALFKIPLYNLLGTDGTAHFNKTYQIYTLLLAISYSGIPAALSRLISAAGETGRERQIARYHSVALPAFAVVGAAVSALMFIFAPQLADFMKDPQAQAGIRTLSPAVFLCCVVSVYEGYAQGHGDMLPTAIKQFLEVTCKLIFGMAVAVALINRGADSGTTAAGAITGSVIGLVISLPVLIAYKRRRERRISPRLGDGIAERGDKPALSVKSTLGAIFRVSVPITLGASFMSVLTLLDSRVVSLRLEASGLTHAEAISKFGIYSQCQTIFSFPPSLISAITVSVLPAISAAAAGKRSAEARGITESAMKLVCLAAMPAAVGITVLSGPIFRALYGVSAAAEDGARILAILGAASFFACAQLLTTVILQANGRERVPMATFVIGGAAQLALDYVLVGDRRIGIIGSPVGTLVCYALITVINLIVIKLKTPDPARVTRSAVKPLMISAVMGAAAYSVYGLSRKLLGTTFGSGRTAEVFALAPAILVAVVIYAVLAVVAGAITREDLKYVPKGGGIADLLRLPPDKNR